MIRLLGMTWDHPRGYDPLVACSAIWRGESGCEVVWERRSLQDFEAYPVAELAQRYDLLVIDHPHVGQIAEERCVLPLDEAGQDAIGPSLASYFWKGKLWALPVDAAAQVQAWRPDQMDAPARSWDEVMSLARAGRVLVPLRPPHALMAFYTLAANAGHPCASEPGRLIEEAAGLAVLTELRALAREIDPACFSLDPIAVLDRMAAADSRIACAPLIYGYVSYVRPGFRARQIRFADLPLRGAVGGTLGGAGIAVSQFTRDPAAAVAVATWLTSAQIQSGPYAAAGGQPAHRAAWHDARLDVASGGFFSATRRTLEHAYLRPRGPRYLPFQRWAAERINTTLRGDDLVAAIADLNAAFARTSGETE